MGTVIRACILFLALAFSAYSIPPPCFPANNKKYDVFLSYRRANGDILASLIKCQLTKKNYTVFLDVDETLCPEGFLKNLDEAVMASSNFIPILTKYSIRPEKRGQMDYMHREIRLAFEHNKNIIPVSDKGFDFADFKNKKIPEDIRKLENYDVIAWEHSYQRDVVDKIVRYIEKGNKREKVNDWGSKSSNRKPSAAVQTNGNSAYRQWPSETAV